MNGCGCGCATALSHSHTPCTLFFSALRRLSSSSLRLLAVRTRLTVGNAACVVCVVCGVLCVWRYRWLHGPHGVVRFAPHDASERLTAEERWARYARDAQGKSFQRALDGVMQRDDDDEGTLERHDEL